MLVSNARFRPVTNSLKQIVLWIILPVGLIGCQPASISLEDVSAEKIDRTVYLTGMVRQIAPLVDSNAYQIEDSTGKIWVVTNHHPPQLGQVIKIEGEIKHQSLSFADREWGDFYVVELEQLPLPVEEKSSARL